MNRIALVRSWSSHGLNRKYSGPEVGFGDIASDVSEALDKGEGFVKDKLVLSGVGDTASRQSLVEDQDLQASR